jgi:hypothetical protein
MSKTTKTATKKGADVDPATLRVPYRVKATDLLAEGKREEAEALATLGRKEMKCPV